MESHVAVHLALATWITIVSSEADGISKKRPSQNDFENDHKRAKCLNQHHDEKSCPTHSCNPPKKTEAWQPDWAVQWAADLTKEFEQGTKSDELCGTSPATSMKSPPHAVVPVAGRKWQETNPWKKAAGDDLKVLRTDGALVEALHIWCDKLQSCNAPPKADLIVTFQPEPPVRSEAQLHERVACMGISVYPRGTSPDACPYAIQGGQSGQYAVTVTYSKDPLVRFTVQLQCAKGNLVIKAKRAVFGTNLQLLVSPVFGPPKAIAAKTSGTKTGKPTSEMEKENTRPLVEAAAGQPPEAFMKSFFAPRKPC